MSVNDLARLKELAEAASQGNTHGPWEWLGGYPQRITNGAAVVIADTFESPDFPAQVAPFIAACDPQTILELVRVAERAEWLEGELTAAIGHADEMEAGRADAIAALREIADPSYVGNYLPEEVVGIYRKWATNALVRLNEVTPE